MSGQPVILRVRTVELEVRRLDGWETVVFADVTKLGVAGAPGDEGLFLTIIGQRDGEPNQLETGVLDVAERHRPLLDGDVPTASDGTAVPVAERDLG